ncbi:MAG: DUF503 domain-containing protein [Firmicutes bacterium]|nr:DUF503 domain-containing protein [Bacillota bacterium]MBR2593043.1 DUF503 domain-containing protein [Bacillota bacterium]
MIIGTCKIYMRAPWVNTLKEKRSVVKRIIERVKSKFNVSIAEIEDNDIHKSIVIGFACVSNSEAHANSTIDNVINFVELISEADIEDVVIEIL